MLFITYDGLADPLGASQILPYLLAIAMHPRPTHVLSFEKPARLEAEGTKVAAQLEAAGILWTPIRFTQGGKLAKLKDLARMYVSALKLQRRWKFGIVHCRSYQAAQVGCMLKRLYAVKVIFDMRGLWVDERVDGGLWDPQRTLDRLAFNAYKRVEKGLLRCADHVVALTHRVVPELVRLGLRADVSVIPCCADFGHFRVLSTEEKRITRTGLGIPFDGFVLSYLGSLGTWYMLDDMLRFFIAAARQRPDIHFLVITRDWSEVHLARLLALGGGEFVSRVHVTSASRAEVPALIGASDVMLSFIKPAYSKQASSPTKLAEAHACGVPAISNVGIGDVDAQTAELLSGLMIDPAVDASVQDAIAQLDRIRRFGGQPLRERAMRTLDLDVATVAYRRVYDVVDA